MKDIGIQLIDHSNEGEVLDIKVEVQTNPDTGLITQGIIIGNTLEQNKALLLMGYPGDFKGNPTLGVGISDILLSTDLLEYRHKVREQFTLDGLVVKELDMYSTDRIKIEASYE